MQLRDRLKQYKKSIWKAQDNDILNYRFRGPDNIKYNCKYPLLFFLHGAGGRGSNNEDQLLDAGSLGAFSKQNIFSKHSSYILAPQVPNDKKWVDVEWNSQKHDMPKISNTMDMALKLLDEIIDTHPININRIYILGLSMGGFGVWDALQRRPNFFAAGVPYLDYLWEDLECGMHCSEGPISLLQEYRFVEVVILVKVELYLTYQFGHGMAIGTL